MRRLRLPGQPTGRESQKTGAYMEKIGEKIKQYRVLSGLTQEELADRTELSKGFISQVERDLTSPSIATLMDILQTLGVSVSEFFNEEQEPQIVFGKEDYFEKEDTQLKNRKYSISEQDAQRKNRLHFRRNAARTAIFLCSFSCRFPFTVSARMSPPGFYIYCKTVYSNAFCPHHSASGTVQNSQG